MCLYWYKQKIWQCEILAHTGSIQSWKTVPPSLASSVESTVSPTPCSISQVPFQGIEDMGQPSTAKQYATQADELAAVQQITQLLPQTSCTTSASISLMDSDDVSVAGAQGGSSSTATKKKHVVNVKPVPRSVVNNTQ